VVVGGSVAIAQFASAEDNSTAACDTVQSSTLRRGGGHNHGGGQQQPNQPAEGEAEAPPAEAPPAEEGGQGQEGQQPEAPPAEEGQGEQPEAPPAEEGQGEQPEAPPAEEGQGEEGQGEEPEAPPAEECEEGEEGEEGEQGGNGQPGVPPGGADGNNNGLEVLARDCTESGLQPHTGFQEGQRCVNTAMGEVSAAAQNPSLLIVGAPRSVRSGENFTLRVSTRNLVRDRFLGAAAGGYFLESSKLNDQQLQRGHYHTACRVLDSLRNAPNPEPAPAFFQAREDGAGGAQPDTTEVTVVPNAPLPPGSTVQCAVWAGDGSHRAPMMQRANQTPAFDAVRIQVRRR
jgi:hypothetical protein